MLGRLGLRRTASEALRRVLWVAEKDHLDEVGADTVAESLQDEDELQPAKELRDDDVATCQQVHSRHLHRHAPGQAPRLVGLIEPASQHGADDIDVEGQRQRVPLDIPTSQRRLAGARCPVDQHQPSHIHTLRAAPSRTPPELALRLWNSPTGPSSRRGAPCSHSFSGGRVVRVNGARSSAVAQRG